MTIASCPVQDNDNTRNTPDVTLTKEEVPAKCLEIKAKTKAILQDLCANLRGSKNTKSTVDTILSLLQIDTLHSKTVGNSEDVLQRILENVRIDIEWALKCLETPSCNQELSKSMCLKGIFLGRNDFCSTKS